MNFGSVNDMKLSKRRSSFGEVIRNFMSTGDSKEEAFRKAQILIDKGYSGDPSKSKKSVSWKFEGTDSTITPSSGGQIVKSSKKGARNINTPELVVANKILTTYINIGYEKVKNLHAEGELSKIDVDAFVKDTAKMIANSATAGIMRFLEDCKKK